MLTGKIVKKDRKAGFWLNIALHQVCIRFTSGLHQEYYKSTSKDEKKMIDDSW
jgi:hypothetical protein